MSAVAAPLPVVPVDLTLPEYEDDEAHPLPLYSQTIGSSECLLQTIAQRRTGCPACEWIFPTKHLRINLGRRQWKISGPAYGLNSTIDGSVTFIHKQSQIESVTATYEGRLKTSTPERIPATDDSSVPFLSFTLPIYKAGEHEVTEDEIPFSIPVPSRLRYKGEETLCPPSFYYSDLHFMCEITYSIRFDVVVKTKFRRTDTKTIPIYYLPKTNPVIPPLCVLPPASRHLENPPLFLSGSDRMESFPILPSFRSKGNNLSPEKLSATQRHRLEEFKSSVYLSLPVPCTFTAGQDIPFMISLSFPTSPHLAPLLSSTPEVQLIKRVGVYRKSSPGDIRPTAERCTLISTATIRRTSGWAEGMVVLKGDIQAGDAGCESSWVLRDAAHVQFFLRIALHPPTTLAKHIPTYFHEEPIELCTSSWGSLEREMASSGGVTTPAVSLTSNLRKLY